MVETSGSGVLPTKTLSHREAVLPFSWGGSRWELVSTFTTCINSIFNLLFEFLDYDAAVVAAESEGS